MFDIYQKILNSLVHLSAEREIPNTLNFSDLIQKFSKIKSKKTLLYLSLYF